MLKRLLRWDDRSDLQKSILLYRLRHTVALLISPFPLPLPWLMRWAGTDKHRPHVPGDHRYGPAYADALRRFRYRRVRFVEIGIGGTADEIGGRSLLAWRAYFPFATLVACDLNDRSALARRRTRIVRLDQGDPRELAAFAKQGPFDVVVDDGSHLGSHQWMTFTALFDTLTEDGLYVVEDVQTSYWDRMVGGVIWGGANPSSSAFAGTCVGRFLDLAKHLNYAEFLDEADADPELRPLARRIRHITFEHNLVMIVKGSNEVPSNTVVRSGPPGSSETGGSG